MYEKSIFILGAKHYIHANFNVKIKEITVYNLMLEFNTNQDR